MSTRDTNSADLPSNPRGRLSSQPQSAPMPRGGFDGIPHPELIRNVDGRTLWDRNVATPFGDNPEPMPDGDDEETFDSDY